MSAKLNSTLKGAKGAFAPPGLVLMIAFFTFGAFAASLKFSLAAAIGLTITTFAIPSQIVLMDELSRGSTLLAATFAASLTAVRLLPLTMSLMPVLRGEKTKRPILYALSQFISITIWLQSLAAFKDMPREQRIPYYLGLCLSLMMLNLLTTTAGFYAAHLLPQKLLAAALMITPVYFFVSLFGTTRTKADKLAFLFGTLLAIPLIWIIPDLALLTAGVAGGSAAYYFGHCYPRRKAENRQKDKRNEVPE